MKVVLHKKEKMKSGIGKSSGRPWVNIQFTVLQNGFDKPTELDMSTFGDNASFIDDSTIGTELEIDGYMVSEWIEYIDKKTGEPKKFRKTEFKVKKVEVSRSDGYVPPAPPVPDDSDGLPF